MVVVHRAHGFRFVIYTDDHEPPHVHVIGDGEAKIDLLGSDGGVTVVETAGIARNDLARIKRETIEQRETFLAHWRRIHGTD